MSVDLGPVAGAALSRRRFVRHVGVAAGLALAGPAWANHQFEHRVPGEVVFSRLPGLVYLPGHVMEKNRLVEKHAARLGLAGLDVRWVNFSTGHAQRDGLVSGQSDVIMSGLVPLLRLWDVMQGGVKGIVASGAMPLSLVSANPRIGSLRDVVAEDRIAVPVLQFSTQAVLLQMAARQIYGDDAWSRFDANCVAMSHSAAFAMLRNRDSAIRMHFSVPPFCFYERKRLREARTIATSNEIISGAHSNVHFYTTTRFADANPVVIEALKAAAVEARGLIEKNTQEAVEAYRTLSGDKSEAADILEALAEPGMMNWQIEPVGTLVFAQHLHRVGMLSRKPESWRDYYLPASHALTGS